MPDRPMHGHGPTVPKDQGASAPRDQRTHVLTLAVLNQKGGAGKTTLATNLAAAAHLAGAPTRLVDLDGQGSALDWYAAREEGSRLEGLSVVKADRALALPRFRELAAGYAVVVLDGPPRLGDVTRAAAVAADVVIVPLQASALDLWAVQQTLDLLETADGIREELGRPRARRVFVLNRAIVGTQLARQVQALPNLELAATVHQRIAFPEATAAGESVLTSDKDGAAAFEIRRLWRIAGAVPAGGAA
jgi:chromosome partitioning protein